MIYNHAIFFMIDGINNTDIVVFSQMYREHSEVKHIASKVKIYIREVFF